jgi:hypothetical protein
MAFDKKAMTGGARLEILFKTFDKKLMLELGYDGKFAVKLRSVDADLLPGFLDRRLLENSSLKSPIGDQKTPRL